MIAGKGPGEGGLVPLSGTPAKGGYAAARPLGAGGPYAHIWEMGYHEGVGVETLPIRTGPSRTDYAQQTVVVGDDKMVVPGTTSFLRGPGGRDHVYESPKANRRDSADAALCPYYHEFDAGAAGNTPGCEGAITIAEMPAWADIPTTNSNVVVSKD